MWELDEHPSVLIGVIALATLYGVVTALMRRRVERRQAAAFIAALLTIFFAVSGPVDALADDRMFSAHMFQHLLLTLVMPPLLLFGVPDWMWRLPLRRRAVKRVARILVNPVIAFVLYNGFLAVIHTPPVFDWMVRDDLAHASMHIGLMVTGTIMWWPLLSPLPELPRLNYPAQTLYMFLLLIPMAAISAPIALSRSVIYPWYMPEPHPWGLSAVADQVYGGLLMWVGGGTYFMCVFTLMFFRWARRPERDEPLVGRPLAAPAGVRVG